MAQTIEPSRKLSETEQAVVEFASKIPFYSGLDIKPTPRQLAFCAYMGPESLFGGAARGGKSWAALMSALQFACVPGYNAIIFRRERVTLFLPGGLVDVSKQWLEGKAKWNGEDFRWTFPSQSTLTFGYLKNDDDIYRYHSSEFQFILFEEVAEWGDDNQYRYMFSRLTPKVDVGGTLPRCRCHGWSVADVPLRMRATANPGGPGTEWVRRRFVLPHREGVKGIFFPSGVKDNPHVDAEAYSKSLANLKSVDVQRLLHGNWDIIQPGEKFNRDWFDFVSINAVPFAQSRIVRWWDMAGARSRSRDSDWTAGALVAMVQTDSKRLFYVVDIQRFKATPGATRDKMLATSESDDRLVGRHVPIRVEREPGSQSTAYIEQLRVGTFNGKNFKGVPSKMSKNDRIDILATEAELGNVLLVEGPWNESFLDELNAIDGSGRTHDDQADATATAMHALVSNRIPAPTGVGGSANPKVGVGYPTWVGGERTPTGFGQPGSPTIAYREAHSVNGGRR